MGIVFVGVAPVPEGAWFVDALVLNAPSATAGARWASYGPSIFRAHASKRSSASWPAGVSPTLASFARAWGRGVFLRCVAVVLPRTFKFEHPAHTRLAKHLGQPFRRAHRPRPELPQIPV